MNLTLSPLVTAALVLLAVAGCFAILHRIFLSVVRLGLAAAQASAVAGFAEVSARRGDLTSLEERREAVTRARSQRRRHLLVTGGWVSLLVLPPVLGWALPGYAAASLLWFLPRRPILRRPGPPPAPPTAPPPGPPLVR
jgi:hypothetical protein